MLGGLVAGEGCFTETARRPGTATRRFVFAMTLASHDRPLLEALRCFIGAGSIQDFAPRRPGWLPQSCFTINSHRAHRRHTIQFAEAFLPAESAKRSQFEEWRARLAAYDEQLGRSQPGDGPSPCSVAGCGLPIRGRGLCRAHYYQATGY